MSVYLPEIWMMKLSSLCAAAVTASVTIATSSAAAVLSYSETEKLYVLPDEFDSLTDLFPAFDPRLGLLQSVVLGLELNGYLQTDWSFEPRRYQQLGYFGRSTLEGRIAFATAPEIDLTPLIDGKYLHYRGAVIATVEAEAYSDQPPCSQFCTGTVRDDIDIDQSITFASAEHLAAFSSEAPTIGLHAWFDEDGGLVEAENPKPGRKTTRSFSESLSATVTLDYVYEPAVVPLPATALSLIGALGGFTLLGASRRRRLLR